MGIDTKYSIGDLKFTATDEGYDISLLEMSPVCDPTLMNAVVMCILTENGWWGNSIDEEHSIGSDVHTVRTVSSKGRSELQYHIEKSLEWVTSEGYARSVDVSVSITDEGRYGIEIGIQSTNSESRSCYFDYLI